MIRNLRILKQYLCWFCYCSHLGCEIRREFRSENRGALCQIHMRTALAAFVVTALLMLIGCGGGNAPIRYEPLPGTARNAIDSALKTWKSGTAFGPIDGKPGINVFDARWQSGKKLESYEILEKVSGSEHPQFKVRLKITSSAEEVNEFLVVGIDPLLVFRDQDYRKVSGQ